MLDELEINPVDNQTKHKWFDLLALVVIILVSFLPRALNLAAFITPDEHFWLTRSANFYYALAQRDFASTYQKEHPGVTTMWAGTAGFLTRYPGYRGSGLGQATSPQLHYYLESLAGIPPLDILATSRAFMILANTLTLALAYLYARRLIGRFPAFLAFVLIAFDPFHAALTRILHLDGSLSNLLLLTLFAYLSFLQKRRWIDLLLSGAAAGLSWLTKSPGFFIVPVIGLVVLFAAWRDYRSVNQISFLIRLWHFTKPLIVWAVVGTVVFVMLWPAMWVQPLTTLDAVFSKATTYAAEGHHSAVFFNGAIAEDGRLGLDYYYFYPLTVLWRTTLVVIIGLGAAVWGFVTRRRPFENPAVRMTLLALVLLVVVFTVGLTLGSKKFDRYLLPAYAPLDITAALGWAALLFWLRGQKRAWLSRYLPAVLLVLIVAAQMVSSLRTFPYYLSYYNPLMGGAQKAPQVMLVGWGGGIGSSRAISKSKKRRRTSARHVLVCKRQLLVFLRWAYPLHGIQNGPGI